MLRTYLLVATLAGASPVSAQTIGNGELVVHPKPASEGRERCVDVSIGSENAYGCINERLKHEVDKVAPPVGNVPPIDARSSDLAVGRVNTPAVQQQYGRNFGVSVFPYRPQQVYAPPLGRH